MPNYNMKIAVRREVIEYGYVYTTVTANSFEEAEEIAEDSISDGSLNIPDDVWEDNDYGRCTCAVDVLHIEEN